MVEDDNNTSLQKSSTFPLLKEEGGFSGPGGKLFRRSWFILPDGTCSSIALWFE